MLDRWIRFAAVLPAACGLSLLAGCGAASLSSTLQISPSTVILLPGQTFQFQVTGSGNIDAPSNAPFLVNGVKEGSPSTGTITEGGLYTAPDSPPAQPVAISILGQTSTAAVTIFNSASFTPGQVSATANVLVASYSIAVPIGASTYIQFGPDTNYGFPTSPVQAPANGGPIAILVAGMRASTAYHMQAVVKLTNGSTLLDSDHTFTTGAIPSSQLPAITAQEFGNNPLSPGIELFSLFPYEPGSLLSAVATDLQGNVIWYYNLEPTDEAFPIKLLANGHMMLNAYPALLQQGPAEIREIDLAGNIINSIPWTTIDAALIGVAPFQLASLHHDFLVLPNGHLMLLGNIFQTINNVPGVPPGTSVLGDVLVEWDPKLGIPVWTWSTFDHLDVARAPYGLPDWTHANAIIYSPDDGNLILSMRDQDWIIKINYRNGLGDGSILWRFGRDGDFTLPPQQAPIEWNYGQHYPTIVSTNSAGIFDLMFFNNGNNRLMDSNGDACGAPGVGACYSSVPVFQLDENAMTATVLWEDNLLPSYSICCGDALVLPNGNTEFDIAYDVGTPDFSHIEEVTPTQQLLWKMDIEGQLAYRGSRIPSLYPGQVWPALQATASAARPALPGPKPAVARSINQLP